jgi:hypothetical protein
MSNTQEGEKIASWLVAIFTLAQALRRAAPRMGTAAKPRTHRTRVCSTGAIKREAVQAQAVLAQRFADRIHRASLCRSVVLRLQELVTFDRK